MPAPGIALVVCYEQVLNVGVGYGVVGTPCSLLSFGALLCDGLFVGKCRHSFFPKGVLAMILWYAVFASLLKSLTTGSSCALSSIVQSAVICTGHVLLPSLLQLSSNSLDTYEND